MWLVVVTGLGVLALVFVTRSGLEVTEQRREEGCGVDRP